MSSSGFRKVSFRRPSFRQRALEMARPRVNLVIVGDELSGKQSLVSRFMGRGFPDITSPLFQIIVDNKVVNAGDREVDLSIRTTPAIEEYDKLRPLAYPDTDVVLACFSVDLAESLENVGERWAPEVRKGCPHSPIVLVGTKIDKRKVMRGTIKTWALLKNGPPLEIEDGKAAAKRIKAEAYVECSARSGEGVEEVFETAVRIALRAKTRRNRTCVIL